MLRFLLSPFNVPFAVALGVMLALALLEVLSVLAGFTLSDAVESALPDVDLDGAEGLDAPGLLGWLHVGRTPLLVLLLIFLTSFGLVGLGTQIVAVDSLGRPLSPWLASIPAFAAGVFSVRWLGGLAGRFVLREETTAVSQDSLLGHPATITLGTTRKGMPSQAKLRDKHGQTHYVLVEPLREGDEFEQGASVMLVAREGARYFIVADDADALSVLEAEGRRNI